jgi:hypothetical protein
MLTRTPQISANPDRVEGDEEQDVVLGRVTWLVNRTERRDTEFLEKKASERLA